MLSFFTYCSLHIVREAWGFFKKELQEHDGLSGGELGLIDSVFLFCYAIGLFVNGVIGDNFNLRKVIAITYTFTACVICIISLGGVWHITVSFYYIFFFALNGLGQSSGWPLTNAIINNWFPKKGRGLLIGFWSTNRNFGNIIGSYLATGLHSGAGLRWTVAFMIMGGIVFIMGILNLLFLKSDPSEVGLTVDEFEGIEFEERISKVSNETLEESEPVNEAHAPTSAISFLSAWKIPGVLPFSLSFCALKLANYAVMFWLPLFCEEELHFSEGAAALSATMYDVGTIIGSVLLGIISDLSYGRRTPTVVVAIVCAAFFHLGFVFVDSEDKVILNTIIFFIGFLVGGVASILSSICVADLGKLDALRNNEKALSTVAGIIDGSGSFGAAVGQVIIGFCKGLSWKAVFLSFAVVVLLSVLPLIRVLRREIKEIREIRRQLSS